MVNVTRPANRDPGGKRHAYPIPITVALIFNIIQRIF